LKQGIGQRFFLSAQRGGFPCGVVTLIQRDKGWLAAHSQAHITSDQIPIHLLAQIINGLP
jgi:hypothetical protein